MLNKISCLSLFFLLLVGCGKRVGPELIVGGDGEILILDYNKSLEDSLVVNWSIDPYRIVSLPRHMIRFIKSVDDHKLSKDGKNLLVSYSGGAVLMIERETRKCVFYAQCPNAHSVEFLPNNRIAVALSTARRGNRVEIYDLSMSEKVLYSDSLYSGHGVVWDESRQWLYALGYDVLRAYTLKDWESETPSLALAKEWKLPDLGGHDLFQSSANTLLLSVDESVWQFDVEKEAFAPFAPIANEHAVKSIYYNETTKQLVYTKGEIEWWTHTIYSNNPNKTIYVPDLKVYKVRLVGAE